ncbi:unnamed protein product, partial [Owenia fusiformis]
MSLKRRVKHLLRKLPRIITILTMCFSFVYICYELHSFMTTKPGKEDIREITSLNPSGYINTHGNKFIVKDPSNREAYDNTQGNIHQKEHDNIRNILDDDSEDINKRREQSDNLNDSQKPKEANYVPKFSIHQLISNMTLKDSDWPYNITESAGTTPALPHDDAEHDDKHVTIIKDDSENDTTYRGVSRQGIQIPSDDTEKSDDQSEHDNTKDILDDDSEDINKRREESDNLNDGQKPKEANYVPKFSIDQLISNMTLKDSDWPYNITESPGTTPALTNDDAEHDDKHVTIIKEDSKNDTTYRGVSKQGIQIPLDDTEKSDDQKVAIPNDDPDKYTTQMIQNMQKKTHIPSNHDIKAVNEHDMSLNDGTDDVNKVTDNNSQNSTKDQINTNTIQVEWKSHKHNTIPGDQAHYHTKNVVNHMKNLENNMISVDKPKQRQDNMDLKYLNNDEIELNTGMKHKIDTELGNENKDLDLGYMKNEEQNINIELENENKDMDHMTNEEQDRDIELENENKDLGYMTNEEQVSDIELENENKDLDYMTNEEQNREIELENENKDLGYMTNEEQVSDNELGNENKDLDYVTNEEQDRVIELENENKDLDYMNNEEQNRDIELENDNKDLDYMTNEGQDRDIGLENKNKDLDNMTNEEKDRDIELENENKDLDYMNNEEQDREIELENENKDLD